MLGHADVDRMLAGMPGWMLKEWMAYDAIDPIDARWRGDLGAATIASLLANIHRNRKKRFSPFGVDDFMPNFEMKQPRDPTLVYRELKAWAIMVGAKPKGSDDADNQLA